MAIVLNTRNHALELTGGRVLPPGAEANVDPTLEVEAVLIASGALAVVDPDVSPPVPPLPDPTGFRSVRVGRGAGADEPVLQVRRSNDVYARYELTGAGDVLVGNGTVAPEPQSAQSGSGSGSLLFAQAEASLTASFRWRAPGAAHFASATLTVADAVTGDVDIAEVTVNGSTVATLSLADGETTSTTAIDIDLATGDGLALSRIAVDGGACQVQLDRGV